MRRLAVPALIVAYFFLVYIAHHGYTVMCGHLYIAIAPWHKYGIDGSNMAGPAILLAAGNS